MRHASTHIVTDKFKTEPEMAKIPQRIFHFLFLFHSKYVGFRIL